MTDRQRCLLAGCSVPMRNYPGVSLANAQALLLDRASRTKGQPLGDGLSSTANLISLTWDSGILNRSCSRIDFVAASGREGAARLATKAVDLADDHISVRFDAEDHHLIEGFAAWEYEEVDRIQTFVWEAKDRPSPTADKSIRLSTHADALSVQEIARKAFTVDRFHSDPYLPRHLADELHAQWGYNSVMGSAADAVVIGEDDQGQVAGFVTCKIQSDTASILGRKVGTIVLVATAPHARGKGLGKRMVQASLEWFVSQDCDLVDVGTQIGNEGARKLYESTGFRLKSTSVSLRWAVEIRSRETDMR